MVSAGEAVAHGAATIINAIATGRGAAFGVDLWTKARVKLTEDAGVIKGRILSDPNEDTALIEKTALKVLQKFGLENRCGAIVETDSNIPIARGLKSSSTAANAIALATLAAINKKLDDLSVVKLGVAAALEAKVTLTGAFDDACASYFGNVIITNNLKQEIVKRFSIKEPLTVLFHVPKSKAYTAKVDVERLKSFAPQVELAYNAALQGRFWEAMTLNGLIYSVALGYDTALAIEALEAGAIAAGLTGKGPAVAAVVSGKNIESVKDAWQAYKGEIIQAKLNQKKAHILG
jgi:shikimate kinase